MRNASSASTVNRVLVDTNIIVYAYDESAVDRHPEAKGILYELIKDGRLVLSAQTLNEFYVVTTRPKRPGRFPHDKAVGVIHRLCSVATVVPVTPALTFRALEAMPRFAMSFWDALIWAAAQEHGIPTLFTEDLQHGQQIEGVHILNPFLPTD